MAIELGISSADSLKICVWVYLQTGLNYFSVGKSMASEICIIPQYIQI